MPVAGKCTAFLGRFGLNLIRTGRNPRIPASQRLNHPTRDLHRGPETAVFIHRSHERASRSPVGTGDPEFATMSQALPA